MYQHSIADCISFSYRECSWSVSATSCWTEVYQIENLKWSNIEL
jgi:hypothetical protein